MGLASWSSSTAISQMAWSLWLLHSHGSSTPCAFWDVSTLRWHSRSLLWHVHWCGHWRGRSMWQVTSNVSGLMATQIMVSADETFMPCGNQYCSSHWISSSTSGLPPCCCHQWGRQFVSSPLISLWTVFELMNDARTHKIRVGSDFNVIKTSTRTYVRTMHTHKHIIFSSLLASVGLSPACPSKASGAET